MAEDGSPAPDSAASDPDEGLDRSPPNTLLNAVIGGVISVFTAFLPLSPIVGGGVAGYLEGGDARDGAKVGGLAGLVALVPLFFLGLLVLFFVPLVGGRGTAVIVLFLVVVGSVLGVYTVGLSVIGGVLGTYLKAEFEG